jgi:hypothetical protein
MELAGPGLQPELVCLEPATPPFSVQGGRQQGNGNMSRDRPSRTQHTGLDIRLTLKAISSMRRQIATSAPEELIRQALQAYPGHYKQCRDEAGQCARDCLFGQRCPERERRCRRRDEASQRLRDCLFGRPCPEHTFYPRNRIPLRLQDVLEVVWDWVEHPYWLRSLDDVRRRQQLLADLSQAEAALGKAEKRRSGNEARDRYCYARLRARRPLAEIRAKVNATAGWEELYTNQGVSQAARRHAERHNLPWPLNV